MSVTLGAGTGPLRGVKVVEIGSMGPGPHAATILADLGADVIRVERPGPAGPTRSTDLSTRGRPSVAMDLKHPEAVATVLELVESADVLIEGMRPGVAERLGIGPDECLARNPRLVYGRMTGWGQNGPWADRGGHDLSYIAVTGALHPSGQDPARPHFALNLVGGFGGGSTYLVIGVVSALLEARTSGLGQVVDAAMVDGASHENLMWASLIAAGVVQERRGVNLLDGGVAQYNIYETSDGEHMAVAAVEPQFLAELLRVTGINPEISQDMSAFKAALTEVFASKTQAEWTDIFDKVDACVTPVLPYSRAVRHPHMVERGVFVEHEGVMQPVPAPRFTRTPATLSTPPSIPGEHTREALQAWGIDPEPLIESGAATQAAR